MFRVTPAGVVTQETTVGDNVLTQYFPHFLPDGRRFLYYQRSFTPDDNAVWAKTLGVSDERLVYRHYGRSVYARGHLFFVREGILYAVRMDERTLETSGEPQRIADGVGYFGGTFGYAAITASADGTLAHGPIVLLTTNLVWRDRSGAVLGTVGSPTGYRSPQLSPNGRSVAVSIVDPQSQSPDIWVLDLTSGGPSRVSSDPRNDWFPVWSPDGERLYFSSTRTGSSTLFQKPPSAPGQGEQVTETAFSGMYATDITADGRVVVAFQTTNVFSMRDVGGGIRSRHHSGRRRPQATESSQDSVQRGPGPPLPERPVDRVCLGRVRAVRGLRPTFPPGTVNGQCPTAVGCSRVAARWRGAVLRVR